MNTTSLRPATASEWQIIQELNNQVFQSDKENDPDLDLDWPFTKKAIEYYQSLADGTHGHCIVAEKNGKVSGYIALVKKDFGWRKSAYVEVDNIGRKVRAFIRYWNSSYGVRSQVGKEPRCNSLIRGSFLGKYKRNFIL